MKHIDALLAQAGDLVKQMEVEIRSHDAATRKVLSEKIAQYKKSLASLRSDFERARTEVDRAKLVGSGGQSSQDRERFLSANEKWVQWIVQQIISNFDARLNRQNETILNATRTVAETEDVAMEITQELGRNREKIESAHSKVREFSGMTDTARRLIHSMSKREIQQKFILVFIALVLAGAIGFVIYYTTK